MKRIWQKTSVFCAALILSVTTMAPAMAQDGDRDRGPSSPSVTIVPPLLTDSVALNAYNESLNDVSSITALKKEANNFSNGTDISVIHGNNITGSSSAVIIQGTAWVGNPINYKAAGNTFTYDSTGANNNFIQNTGASITGNSDQAVIKGVSYIVNAGSNNNYIDSSTGNIIQGIVGNGASITNGRYNTAEGTSTIYNLGGANNLIATMGAQIINGSYNNLQGLATIYNSGSNSNISSLGAFADSAYNATAIGSSLVINSGSNVKWSSSGVAILNK
jgi:hypothetical protein